MWVLNAARRSEITRVFIYYVIHIHHVKYILAQNICQFDTYLKKIDSDNQGIPRSSFTNVHLSIYQLFGDLDDVEISPLRVQYQWRSSLHGLKLGRNSRGRRSVYRHIYMWKERKNSWWPKEVQVETWLNHNVHRIKNNTHVNLRNSKAFQY